MTSAAETLGWTDLLSNHNIKPWWETLRSLILVAMTLNTTFMLIYAKDIGVSCVPVANVTYGAAQSKYIEAIFGWELLRMVRILVWLSVLATGLMFVASNYWLYWPSVGDAVIRFSKALDLHNDLHAALPSLESAVTTPNKQKTSEEGMKRRNQLRQFCTLLRSFMDKNEGGDTPTDVSHRSNPQSISATQDQPLTEQEAYNVESHEGSTDEFIKIESPPVRMVRQFVHHYQLRNIICCVMSALLTAGSTIFLIYISSYQMTCLKSNPQCQIPDYLQSEYLCVVIAFDVALGTAITLVVLLTVQVGIFLCFWWRISEKHDLDLLQKFAEKSSDKEIWQTFGEWVSALKQEPANLAKKAKKYFQSAIDERDVDFFYFVQNTLGLNIRDVLTAKKAKYHQTRGYKSVHFDLQRIAGKGIPKPDLNPATSPEPEQTYTGHVLRLEECEGILLKNT